MSQSVRVSGTEVPDPGNVCLNFSDPGRNSATFSCSVTNMNEAIDFEREWFKDNRIIPNTMQLDTITITMTGTYRCRAQNACGAGTGSAVIRGLYQRE